MDLPEAVQARIDAIRQNRTSGAVELAQQAAESLVLLARKPQFSREALREAARALVSAQPTMAPIFNLANRVLFRGTDDVEAACREFVRDMENAAQAIAALAAERIEDGGVVMTHSYSSTVLNALLAARRAGTRFDVICTESRPLCEGVTLAKALAGNGIRVKLILDAAMLGFVREARLILTGADSVSVRGLMNKTGTAMLALAARTQGVDACALCGSEKFLPAGYSQPAERPKDPGEILAEPVPGVTAVNYYFDSTPLERFSGIVTEEGVLAPADLKIRLSALPVHDALLVPQSSPDP
ncbi:MAG: initiation factor 2B [Acidobacteria bacterium]|nr:initiation factor 2B [Acidobacteriota bacterium]